MAAKDDLLALLRSGGHAEQERGYGPFVFGSDGRTYAARTARALEREGLAHLSWARLPNRWAWAWRAGRAPGVQAIDGPVTEPLHCWPDGCTGTGTGCRAVQAIPSEWSCDCAEPGPRCRPTGLRRNAGVAVPGDQTEPPHTPMP